jgi:hypothetical protein
MIDSNQLNLFYNTADGADTKGITGINSGVVIKRVVFSVISASDALGAPTTATLNIGVGGARTAVCSLSGGQSFVIDSPFIAGTEAYEYFSVTTPSHCNCTLLIET